MKTYDVIVLGLGAMGSAATYQLAKKGVNVLGIDQYAPPHMLGSSHGDTRITRQALGEGAEYVPLVLRAYELWREIENETGNTLLTITGGLVLSKTKKVRHNGNNFFDQTVASAKKYHIPHTLLTADQIKEFYPQFKVQGDEKGYFENNAGYLRPELCIKSQLELAKHYGAKLALNEKIINFRQTAGNKVVIKTTKETYEAEKLVISAGSWIAQLLNPELRKYFTIHWQVLYWFDVDGQIARFESPQFPVWIWDFDEEDEDGMYGFPAINGQSGGVKLATEQYKTATTPGTIDRHITKNEITQMYQKYVGTHFNGINARCIKALTCIYTVTPDHNFVIDTHPEYTNIIIASPCSGHGFKHSAAIGEVLSELATDGKNKIDISKFSFKRFSE